MKIFTVLLALVVMALNQAFADLYCYSCFSYESEQKCWENRRKIQCAWQEGRHALPTAFDTCIKYEVNVEVIESMNGTTKLKAVENKGYGMYCGRKRHQCGFLPKCRNYWGIHGKILEAGCKVQCCHDNNSTCKMPGQTPIEANIREVGARSSRGTQFRSRELIALVLLMAKHIFI